MDPELKTEFARLHARLDAVDRRFDAVDQRFDAIDRRVDAIDGRVDGVDDRLDRLTRGMAQQFEAQQQYMDTRFNEILEVLDFRHSNHERRIKRLEGKVFGAN